MATTSEPIGLHLNRQLYGSGVVGRLSVENRRRGGVLNATRGIREQIFSHILDVDLPACFNYSDAQPASWAPWFVKMKNPRKTRHATAY